jgi:hypothetical protein
MQGLGKLVFPPQVPEDQVTRVAQAKLARRKNDAQKAQNTLISNGIGGRPRLPSNPRLDPHRLG